MREQTLQTLQTVQGAAARFSVWKYCCLQGLVYCAEVRATLARFARFARFGRDAFADTAWVVTTGVAFPAWGLPDPAATPKWHTGRGER